MPEQRNDLLFISYSHRDEGWLKELQTFLKPYEPRWGSATDVWDDTRIRPGTKWKVEIKEALARAKVAVLLVTENFLASDFIAEHELPPLLKAAEGKDLTILWVAVKPTAYEETEIADYQCVNEPSKPLISLEPAQRSQKWVEICREIDRALSETALRSYCNRMRRLLTDEQLRGAEKFSEKRLDAQRETRKILQLLTRVHKKDLLDFLHREGLIKKTDPNFAYPVIGLEHADLANADLSGIDLSGDAIKEADLRGANLRGANLSYTELDGSDLSGANLTDADLGSARLANTNVTTEQIAAVKTSANALLPADV